MDGGSRRHNLALLALDITRFYMGSYEKITTRCREGSRPLYGKINCGGANCSLYQGSR